MKALAAASTIVFALSVAGCRRPAGPRPLVFTDVTVIDATGASPKTAMMVVVIGDKLTRIEKYEPRLVPGGADVVNGTGKFLVPGLWDMHVHWYDERYLPLFIANGVTGLRQMFGTYILHEWRRKISNASLMAPRMFIASTLIDGPIPVWPGSIAVQNEAEARAAVSTVKKDGADFVKVYEQLPRDAYFGIADQSRKERIPFAGHVPFTVRLSEASDAGQKSVEHLTGVFIEASRQEEKIRNELIKGVSSSGPGGWSGLVSVREAKQLLDAFDDEKAESIYQRLAKNQTWQTPTLTVLRAISSLDDSAFTNDPRLKYMPRSIQEQWKLQNNPYLSSWKTNEWVYGRPLFEKELHIVGEMRRQGVRFLAGTDTGNPFCFPGFSLHDELSLLVTAGLTSMEALQAATRNAAEYPGEPSAKLDVVVPRVIEAVDEGHKTLVFSQFTSLLAILRSRLDETGAQYEYLDGRTRDRQAKVERFQRDPGCRLFLISLKAGGLGLNLTAAEYVFLLDPWWNPAVEAQAIDRAHRIGQARHVFAYRLIARDTVEERVLELQQRKRTLADAILTADNSLIRHLRRQDLELLLS